MKKRWILSWTKGQESMRGKALLGMSLLILGAGLSACDTIRTAPQRGDEEIHAIMPVPKARNVSAEGTSTGVLLSYEFKGAENVVKGSGCRLRIENKEARKSAFISLPPEGSSAFLALEPGTYNTVRLGCGVSLVWDIKDIYTEGFKVEQGRVSYIGKLVFEFEANTLETVRKASRTESVKAFQQASNSVNDKGHASFISGFTGRQIEEKMAMSEPREGFDVFAKGTENASRLLQPLLGDLKGCGTEATKKDPLRMGQLTYVARYQDGKFREIKERRDENAFSDDLRFCVEKAMARFQPESKGELELRVSF